MFNNSSTALIVFIKNPQKGKVKTRLAATVGDDKALAIYKALMDHTRHIALATDAQRLLFYSQQINSKDNWSNQDFIKHLQTEGNLGIKMKAAFQTAFQNADKVIIIGSDCASLSPDIITEAFAKLETHDFVIGPAMDGGYYLLGMNNYEPAVFEEISWSTESVLKETIRVIETMDKSYTLLVELSDIDYEEDWIKWGWEL
ncbi:MAG: TIGR04282 family arsenosugar biosynthesis glycosyltransferase [Saprospiraceae bacterium]